MNQGDRLFYITSGFKSPFFKVSRCADARQVQLRFRPPNDRRGGFYRQYITSTNNLYKPAPTPAITYMNLDVDPRRKKYMGIYRWVGAGLLYCRLLTIIVGETRPLYLKRVRRQIATSVSRSLDQAGDRTDHQAIEPTMSRSYRLSGDRADNESIEPTFRRSYLI